MLTVHFFNFFCVYNKVRIYFNTGNDVFGTQLMLCCNSGMSVHRLEIFLFYSALSIHCTKKKVQPFICVDRLTCYTALCLGARCVWMGCAVSWCLRTFLGPISACSHSTPAESDYELHLLFTANPMYVLGSNIPEIATSWLSLSALSHSGEK